MADTETTETLNSFTWGRLIALFSPHRGRVFLVVVVVLVSAGLGIVNPLLTRRVFDDALFPGTGTPDVGLLTTLIAIMLTVAFMSGAFGVAQTILTNRLGQNVLRDLRDDLYQHLQTLPLSFFAGARTGDLQSRITSDVGGVQTAVTTTLSNILWNGVAFLSALIAMLVLSPALTGITLATVPVFLVATRWVGRKREKLTAEAQAATAEMSVVTQETLSVSGITLAKLFGRQHHEIERFTTANKRLAHVTSRQQAIGQGFFTVILVFLGAAPILVYLVAGLLLDGGSGLTAGTIVAVTTLQNRLFFPVARLLETVVQLQSSRAMFRRIFEYLDTEPEIIEAADAVDLTHDSVEGLVRFDEVTFRYDGTSNEAAPSLESFSMDASPGMLVALVGPSGAGKSTVLSLIARLYDPTTGVVSIDGVDLRDLSFASLADTIGFVTQESYLFAGSLRDNIAYGRPEATDDEIEQAGRAAAIHDRIMEFDEGYDTVVGERGFRLSGGERQRVAIARVLLHDPKVLVLDEATSALDTASERKIQSALGDLVEGRTTLAVAHRLSTIQSADVIHVIDHGRIIESGTHDDLVEAGGVYRTLYDEQFGSGTIETHCADGVIMTNGQWRSHEVAAAGSS